jgi:hypothetical protein
MPCGGRCQVLMLVPPSAQVKVLQRFCCWQAQNHLRAQADAPWLHRRGKLQGFCHEQCM